MSEVREEAVRLVAVWSPVVLSKTLANGTVYIRQRDALGPYPDKLNSRLLHWAAHAPDRVWMAERDGGGGWRTVTYAEAAETVAALAQAMLDRGLGADRPLLILSGNSLAHALMALAAQHVGIPSAAIAPAYALVSEDYEKLRDIVRQLSPGMIFAEDASAFAKAIVTVCGEDVPVVCVSGEVPGRTTSRFSELAATPVGEAVARAYDAVGPDTVAKFLFTSGTTGSPKAVIQTQRMLCSNQAMIADCYAFLAEAPPVVVDWAPWNHTASGNKVFNMTIWHGGTFYIDEGKPSPKGIAATIANLREISPTWYFNVPIGYQMLVEAMEADEALCASFFRNLSMLVYAGAGMSQSVWDRLTALGDRLVPGGVMITSGYGATETGPFSMTFAERQGEAGNIGIPARGVTLKLVPSGDKLEARLSGPSITPGYWRNPQLSAEAFDEEGFYKLGDALRYAVPGDPSRGFLFDGRLAENFKLDTGTWVAVGPLRERLVNALEGLAADVVIAGENRAALAALVLPNRAGLRAIAGEGVADDELLSHPAVVARASALLAAHAATATGSANGVRRMMFLAEPPQFDKGEVTDKGSLNQRAMLRHRADLVEALYRGDDARVIVA